MKIIVSKSERWTRSRPLWVWRVFDGGRSWASGFAASQREATEQAKDAMRRLQIPRMPSWLFGEDWMP